MTTTATYAYCVVRSDGKPPLARVPAGMPGGGRPRALKGPRDTWVVVSDVPLASYNSEAINANLQDLEWVARHAVAHESVVEFCSRAADVIPMKLFTIFRDDVRAMAHVGGAALADIFRRIAGCAEWSVRMTFAQAGRDDPSSGEVAPSGLSESGTAFLRRKKTQRDRSHQAMADAGKAVEQVYERLDRMARDSVRKEGDVPGTALLLDAAFLVPRKRQTAFTTVVKRLVPRARKSGCELVLTGPWPPYHFVAGS